MGHIDDDPYLRSVDHEIETHPELKPLEEDWKKTVDMVREAAERSDRQAAMVMHEFQATKRPFVLYLRTFESEAYRYFDKPGANGDPTKVWTIQHGATTCEQKLGAALASRLPLLGIANPADLTTRAIIPRLQLPDDGWQAVARNLIENTEFIVLECDALAPGVVFELETIQAAGREEATIVVLPPRGGDGWRLAEIAQLSGADVTAREVPTRDDARFARFRRIAAEDEIDFERLESSPLFADLLAPAMAKAAAAPPFDAKAYATQLNNLGVERFGEKQFAEAIGLYQQALLIRRHIDDRAGVVTSLYNIACVFIEAGQPQDSETFLSEAHALARELQRPADEGLIAATLGVAMKLRGDLKAAINWLTIAVPLQTSPDDLKNTLVHLAKACADAGDRDQAMLWAQKLRDLGMI